MTHCFRPAWSGSLILLLAVTLTGCGRDTSVEPADSGNQTGLPAAPSRPLQVLVIDDEAIGPVMARQYSARRNGTVDVTDVTWSELAESQFAEIAKYDVVVYPGWRMGELIARSLVRAVGPDDLRNADSRRSVLFFDRLPLVTWDDELMGVSLGQSLPVMLCRQDVLEACQSNIPESWQEFSDLAAKISAGQAGELPTGIGIPLAGHWASQMLLVRTAPAVRAPGRYSALFDVGDMTPLIDSEPYLRALQAWAREIDPKCLEDSPRETLNRFMAGELAIAMTPINPRLLEGSAEPDFEFQLAGVPGNPRVFDPATQTWTPRGPNDSPQVPLVGSNAIVASVTSSTSRGRVAAEFLAWLQDKQISALIAIESSGAGPSRKSHLANSGKWLGPGFSSYNASAYGQYVQSTNENKLCLNALRIPEAERYLDLLDAAIRQVISGQANAVESLASVSREWARLNESIGSQQQRAAYRNSCGLAE